MATVVAIIVALIAAAYAKRDVVYFDATDNLPAPRKSDPKEAHLVDRSVWADPYRPDVLPVHHSIGALMSRRTLGSATMELRYG